MFTNCYLCVGVQLCAYRNLQSNQEKANFFRFEWIVICVCYVKMEVLAHQVLITTLRPFGSRVDPFDKTVHTFFSLKTLYEFFSFKARVFFHLIV